MTQLVVDASVAVKWAVPEIHDQAAERVLMSEAELIAPDFLLAEVAQAFIRKVRQAEITHDDAEFALTRIDSRCQLWPCAKFVQAAFRLAERFGRSAYDSMYVALAVEQSCQLVTADRRLFDAVGPHLPDAMLWIEDVR